MTQGLSYTTFSTDAGWVGALGSIRGLMYLTFPHLSEPEARRLLGSRISQATQSPHLFRGLMERIRAYFSGLNVIFPDELDLTGYTNFQHKVWETTRLIPFGETRSYVWVAQQIGKPGAARAVGQALGRNPLPIIIPCHRVLGSNGRLTGFGGGVDMKRHLLSLETAGFITN